MNSTRIKSRVNAPRAIVAVVVEKIVALKYRFAEAGFGGHFGVLFAH